MSLGSKKIFIIFGMVVLLGYGAWSILSSPVHNYTKPDVPGGVFPVKSHIDIDFKVQNKTQRKLDNAELRFILPAKQTSTQWVKKVSSSMPVQILPDLIGNQVAYFQFDPLMPKDDLDIRISVDLQLAEVETETTKVVEGAGLYLSNDPLLDISHPKIQALASQLVSEKVEVSVNNILIWLEENKKKSSSVSVSEVAGTEFVRAKFEERTTDDIAASEVLFDEGYLEQDALYLLIALTRAMKVPSRVVVGLKTDGKLNGVYTFDNLMIYSEVLLDKGWRVVDLGGFKLTKMTDSLTLRRLEAMPARLEIIQPYRLLFESVGVEFVAGSEKYRFSPGV